MEDHVKELTALLDKSVIDFFNLIGHEATNNTINHKELSNTSYCSSLGFVGEKMRGSLAVLCSKELLQNTHPQSSTAEQDFNDSDQNDWTREIANQIVGNFKRMVSAYNIDFSLDTPLTIKPTDLDFLAGRQEVNYISCYFDLQSGGEMKVVLSAKIKPGISFDDNATELSGQIQSGESVLF